MSGVTSSAGKVPGVKTKFGNAGAPGIALGVAPGVATREGYRLSVVAVAALSVIETKGTALGFVEANVSVGLADAGAAVVAAGATEAAAALEGAAEVAAAEVAAALPAALAWRGSTMCARTEVERPATATRLVEKRMMIVVE